jgi:hypothetical protein
VGTARRRLRRLHRHRRAVDEDAQLGRVISAIRQQVQNDYRPRFPDTETPTPAPPAGK